MLLHTNVGRRGLHTRHWINILQTVLGLCVYGLEIVCVYYRLDWGEGERRASSASSASSLVREGQELITMPSRFEEVQKRGTIDVWWIYDDGGQPLP